MPDCFLVQSRSHRQEDVTENKTLACACLETILGIRPFMHSHRPLALQPTATGPTQLTSSAIAILEGLLNIMQFHR